MKFLRTLLLVTAACLPLTSCVTTGSDGPGGLNNVYVGYTGDGVEVTGFSGDATGAGWDLKKKTAYYIDDKGGYHYFTGIKGAGFGGDIIGIYLKDGSKLTIDTRTGKINTSAPPPVAPPDKPQ